MVNITCLFKNKIIKIIKKNLQKVWKLLKYGFFIMQVNIDTVPLLEKQLKINYKLFAWKCPYILAFKYFPNKIIIYP